MKDAQELHWTAWMVVPRPRDPPAAGGPMPPPPQQRPEETQATDSYALSSWLQERSTQAPRHTVQQYRIPTAQHPAYPQAAQPRSETGATAGSEAR